MPPGSTANAKFYRNFLKRLCKENARVLGVRCIFSYRMKTLQHTPRRLIRNFWPEKWFQNSATLPPLNVFTRFKSLGLFPVLEVEYGAEGEEPFRHDLFNLSNSRTLLKHTYLTNYGKPGESCKKFYKI